MRLLAYGDSAVLVQFDGMRDVLALYAQLAEAPPPGIRNMVPATRTLLIEIDVAITTQHALAEIVRRTPLDKAQSEPTGYVRIPVTYDGPDLSTAAHLTGLEVPEVIAEHTRCDWTVAFCGFSPGFGYLVSDDSRLNVPRRSDPRTSVPAGSVGLAGEFTGVYPNKSPGGWQIIGHTTASLWEPAREPPALLSAGVHVRFEVAECAR